MNEKNSKQPVTGNQQIETNEQRPNRKFSNDQKPVVKQNAGTTQQLEDAFNQIKKDGQ